MDNLLFSPVPLADLLKQFREIIKEEIRAEQQHSTAEKLLSPAEACKVFDPVISKVTLTKWTKDGLISMQKIGGRVFYRQTDIIEAGSKLKRYKNKP